MSNTDPFQDFLYRLPQPLDALFLPKTIAVIGATETAKSVGRTIMSNLTSAPFEGEIFPVNPKYDSLFGLKSYPSIGAIPSSVDCAVIVTPAKTVPRLVQECVDKGVKGLIIISAGFKELGPPGVLLEQEILKIAAKSKIRIIGPNCLGLMNPIIHLNATFASKMALPGKLAFISQSGAMCTAVLDWSLKEKIGFSAFISIGSMADVDFGALIDYLSGDPHTESILIYMESIGNAHRFLSAAKEAALTKPIILIKAGRTEAAAKAAVSHTGALVGSDDVFEAALQRVGVLRVNTIEELFSMASILAKQPLPKGPRLTIVTNAGGPGVLATDALTLAGGILSVLDPQTVEKLDTFLPAAWSHGNPLDILGDATPSIYGKALEVASEDPNTDGILVILAPQDMTEPLKTAEHLLPFVELPGMPLLASWMGGETVEEGMNLLNQNGIPTFSYPDHASHAFATMWRYSDALRILYETPRTSKSELSLFKQKEVTYLLEKVRNEGRVILTEFESKQVCSAYGIPVVETHVATTVTDALKFAKKMGFPLVLKLFSETITHKTDVGGVKLNLKDEKSVEKAFEEIKGAVPSKDFQGVTVQKMISLEGYELILGSSIDPQFGPTLLFGMGGQLVEVLNDKALALPPLNANLARRLIQQTKVSAALKGVRGRKPVDMHLLEDILVSFSQLIVEQKWIQECDINPLLVSEKGCIALDARIVLHPLTVKEEDLPRCAIRPYPSEYVFSEALKDQTEISLRPIRPEDEPLLIQFHKELSEKSVRQRYFAFVSLNARIAHQHLMRIAHADYDRSLSLGAFIDHKMIGLAKITKLPGTEDAYFNMIISDDFQYQGLGTFFLERILEIAKKEEVAHLHASILEDNIGMLKICKRKGFSLTPDALDPKIINALLKVQRCF